MTHPQRSSNGSSPATTTATDGAEWASLASLRYVSDASPGITRQRRGTGFSYRDAAGKVIRDATILDRVRQLAIPPAWTSVWIAPSATGHIQATGRDARGRKQYRYHARWHAVRDENKYGRMLEFGAALPKIRARVQADLQAAPHSRERVLAIVVRLLETTYIRVGNEEYAKANGSFGLTTLRRKHLRVSGDTLRFEFAGKSGKTHAISVEDRRLSRLVRSCRELPGQLLFQFRHDDGSLRPIDSADVNSYLREISGADFTAKDFRTWAGTLLAAALLDPSVLPVSEPAADPASPPTLTAALKQVSQQLGNTPAVCRKGYVHPTVLEAYGDEAARARWVACFRKARSRAGLTREESALLAFLGDD
ncbi:MAG: DNA topoisomerase IB [Gemmatimonadota bacterium]